MIVLGSLEKLYLYLVVTRVRGSFIGTLLFICLGAGVSVRICCRIVQGSDVALNK